MKARRLVKKGGVYHVRLRRGSWDTEISTGQSTRRAADEAAGRIVAEFDREKTSRQIATLLCRYARELAFGGIGEDGLRGALSALEGDVYRRAAALVEEIFPARAFTCSDLWRGYSEWLARGADPAKPQTLADRERKFQAFARWAGDRDVRRMDASIAARFLQSLGASGQTVNNYISALSVVFQHGGGAKDVWQGLRVKAVHEERKEADIGKVKAFLEYCGASPSDVRSGMPLSMWAAFVRTLYYTGLRPVDACLLERRELRGDVLELLPEKTSRTRRKVSFRVHPALLRILSGLPDDGSGLFFPELARQYRVGRGNIIRSIHSFLAADGRTDLEFSLYGLRHHFVTAQLDCGADMDDVAAAVGHSSSETTSEFYYHGRRAVKLGELPEI